jgi:hypothetical protein
MIMAELDVRIVLLGLDFNDVPDLQVLCPKIHLVFCGHVSCMIDNRLLRCRFLKSYDAKLRIRTNINPPNPINSARTTPS